MKVQLNRTKKRKDDFDQNYRKYLALSFAPVYGSIIKLIFGQAIFNENSIPFIGLFVFAMIVLISLFPIGYFAYKNIEKLADNSYTKAYAIYSVEKPNWNSAIVRWNRSYYCHRNSIVFDPENGETCEPIALMEFLYKSAGG